MVPVQLTVRGQSSAFDLSYGNDVIAVSSPGCIAFYHLNGYGSPKHVIHYEQPQQIRQLKYQRGGQSLLAALRGPSVSLWDSAHSVRPLKGLISSRGWITDIDWHNQLPNILATTCDCGDLQIIDNRNHTNYINKLNLSSFTNSVQWCSSNPNLFSAVCDRRKLHIWDFRMLSDDGNNRRYKSIAFENNIIQSCWGNDDANDYIIVGTANGSIEWWNITNEILSETNDMEINVNRHAMLRPPIVDESSLMLSVGKAVIVARMVREDSIEVNLHAPERLDYPGNVERLFQVPRSNADEYSDGPSMLLTECNESILGIRKGTPGRLNPPPHPGAELLVFTESSKIFPVKIRSDIIVNYCGGRSSLAMSRDPSRRELGDRRSASPFQADYRAAPKYTLNDLKQPYVLIDNNRNDVLDINAQVTISDILSPSPQLETFDPSEKASNTPSIDSPIQINHKIPDIDFTNYFLERVTKDVDVFRYCSQLSRFSHLFVGDLDILTRTIIIGLKKEYSTAFKDRTIIDLGEVDAGLSICFPNIINETNFPEFNVHLSDLHEPLTQTLMDELNVIAATAYCEFKVLFEGINSDSVQEYKASWNSSKDKDIGFLLPVLDTFRNHILQHWESTTSFQFHSESVPYSNLKQGNNESGIDSESKRENAIVDEKAYRIPFPPLAGARFSSRGILVFFGNAMLLLGDEVVIPSHELDSDMVHQLTDLLSPNVKKSKLELSMKMKKWTSEASSAIESIPVVAGTTATDLSRDPSQDDHRLLQHPSNTTTKSLPSALRIPVSVNTVNLGQYNQNNIKIKSYGDFVLKQHMDREREEEEYLYDLAKRDRSDGLSENRSLSTRTKRSDSRISIHSELSTGSFPQSSGQSGRYSQDYGSVNSPNNNYDHNKFYKENKVTLMQWKLVSAYQVTEDLEQNLGLNYRVGSSMTKLARDRESSLRQCIEACHFNSSQAAIWNAPSTTIQLWDLFAVCLEVLPIPESWGGLISWNESSLGYPLLLRLISYLIQSADISTFGTILCILGGSQNVRQLLESSGNNNRRVKMKSETLNNDPISELFVSMPKPFHSYNDLEFYFESILIKYYDLLYQWCDFNKATEVRKYFSLHSMRILEGISQKMNEQNDTYDLRSKTNESSFDIDWECYKCGTLAVYKTKADVWQANSSNAEDEDSRIWCRSCGRYALQCGICQSPVRGVSYTCMICGHGGHPDHMKEWFAKMSQCPTGKCNCLCGDIETMMSRKNRRRGINHDAYSLMEVHVDDDGNDEEDDEIYMGLAEWEDETDIVYDGMISFQDDSGSDADSDSA